VKSQKEVVLDAVERVLSLYFNIVSERDKEFCWVMPKSMQALCGRLGKELNYGVSQEINIVAQAFFPDPINCIIQFDDETHCNQERARIFDLYPPGIPLNFDVWKYTQDQRTGGTTSVIFNDVMTDLLAPLNGLNPTVRIRRDEVGLSVSEYEAKIRSLLARRFAIHAGTTFGHMLDNAGAKPHRAIGLQF